MRLWSLHPRYLDPKGLVALWREGLLARAVLRGETRGYRHHPQLQRFQQHPEPEAAIDAYLHGVLAEATARGYRFDGSKLGAFTTVAPIEVTTGQVDYEWTHLLRKLETRHPQMLASHRRVATPECHPSFECRPGAIASWERP
jgi:hypothetical protein